MSTEDTPPLFELADVEVLVVGRALVGQLLGRLLEDQGASVKFARWPSHDVEAEPVGEIDDHEAIVDLDGDAGRAGFDEIIARTDVLIDVLADGALAESGRGFERLIELQPALLCCAVRPYPADAKRQGTTDEWKLAAALGFYRLGGGHPQVLPIPLASGYGALYGAVNIVVALLEQLRTGAPKKVETSVFGASLMALTGTLTRLENSSLGEAKGPFRSAGDLRYRCADGRSVQITSNVPSVVEALFRVFDRPDWCTEALADLTSETEGRSEAVWHERLKLVFLTCAASEWEQLISAAGGACALCRTSQEWLVEPHALATGVVVKTARAEAGPSFRAGPVVRLQPASRAPQTAEEVSGPATRELRNVTSHRSEVLPLSGKRVVEFSVILAGPSAGRVLAEFGADVIKIDAPHRAKPPYIGQKGWLDVNRTKRSALIDLRSAAGAAATWQLIERADVVIQGYRTDKIAALGFGPDQVFARNPRAVYVSLNAYDFGGEFSARPGWEPLAQAVTGIHLEPDEEGVPPRVPLPMNDFGSGLSCAYGALLGLRAVERTGYGVHVRASLARTATFFMQTELGRGSSEVPRYLRGRQVRFLQCQDGWVAISADESVLNDLTSRDELMIRVATLPTQDVGDLLAPFGVESTTACVPGDLSKLEWLRTAGLIASWDHPEWGLIEHPFPEAAVTGINHRNGWPAEDPGGSTIEVLMETGLSLAEVAQLLDEGSAQGRVALF